MEQKLCPVQLDPELHERLKEYSRKSGIKIKKLVEASIISYLNRMKFQEDEGEENGRN